MNDTLFYDYVMIAEKFQFPWTGFFILILVGIYGFLILLASKYEMKQYKVFGFGLFGNPDIYDRKLFKAAGLGFILLPFVFFLRLYFPVFKSNNYELFFDINKLNGTVEEVITAPSIYTANTKIVTVAGIEFYVDESKKLLKRDLRLGDSVRIEYTENEKVDRFDQRYIENKPIKIYLIR